MTAADFGIINTEPTIVRGEGEIFHRQDMIAVIEIISEADELLIYLAGITSRNDSMIDTVNTAREVSMVRIKISIERKGLSSKVEPKLGCARLRVVQYSIIAFVIIAPRPPG